MKDKIIQTRTYLLNLINKINKSEFPHDTVNWGGADVGITNEVPEKKSKSWYPEPRYVVTPFSHELSWLFLECKQAFRYLIEGTTKIEFYGRLANMAYRYQEKLKGEKENEKDLLLAVLHEAFSILEEIEDGKFQYLLVAFGNEIYDDIIESAEKEGYLGVEKTREFLKEMDNKYNDA